MHKAVSGGSTGERRGPMDNPIEHPATAAANTIEVEAYQALLARAHRKTGAVPPELVVRHILAVTAGADWPVRREALEALLRRVAFGKADGLRIVSRPGGGRLLGLYATRRKGSPARPYRTLLRRLDPIVAHCDCADFLRSSLGLCKHLLAVLEDLTAKPRAFEKARREPAPNESPLRWDPVRPPPGPGHSLAQGPRGGGPPGAGDRGLGKPARATAACHALGHPGRVRRGLLVVPAALKPQWLREWRLFTDAPAAVIDGNPGQRRAAFDACRRGFLVVNYEQLLRDLGIVRDWNPDLVVLDEAQRIKNWATKTALTVKQLDPPFRLVLTGTPMENRIDELASIVEWVDDLALEPKWRLVPWHTTPVDGKTEIGGARNLDTLRSRLAGCMIRRIRKEVLSQLPERTDTRIPIEMTPEQVEEHDALNMPIAQLLARSKRRPLTQAEFLKLMMLLTTQRIIANGLAQLRFEEIWPDLSRIERPTETTLKGLSCPKLLELRELIGQIALDQGRKVVVFSQWRRMLRLAHWATRDVLARDNVRAAFFTGEEGQKRRTQNIVEFHDDHACRVLFATDAGGVGLNLQRAASACINIELPWNPAVLEQRVGRIYRLGQNRPIDVYNLVSEPGIESRISDLVGTKQAFFVGLFDGTSDEVAFERSGSFLSRIERIVAPALERAPARGVEAAEADDGPAEREIDAIVAAGDESRDARVPGAPEPAPPPSAVDVQKLFSGLTVQRTAHGGLVIEAPPETAATLAALFAGMARLLQTVAPGPAG